ncbi:MAG: CAP domain-containing protein, partial [Rhizobiales bacterium]|nr:CAP domain-containing protein [Hyphomicrobiales bacterium]
MDICTVLGFLALAGCATPEPPQQPAFYDNLARAEAQVNINAAASLLSDYRRKNGLPPVEIDTRLVEMA